MTDSGNRGRKTLGSLGYTEEFTWGSEQAQNPEPPVAKRHWGKYRGTVVDNQDPTASGRLLVSVPGIVTTNWAMPCVPVTDILTGTFMRPGIDSNVWVEFERGDPDKPIWVGCWWGEGEIPVLAQEYNAVPAAPAMTMESTTAGISVCDVPILAGGDTPGNVNLTAGEGAVTIALTPGSVNITAPVVTTTAEAAVNITAPTGTVNISAPAVTISAPVVTIQSLPGGEVTIETDIFRVTAAVSQVNGFVQVNGDLLVDGGLEVVGGAVVDGVPVP